MLARRKYLMLVVLMITVIGLAGCGKKSGLEPPADADPKHPRQYPAP